MDFLEYQNNIEQAGIHIMKATSTIVFHYPMATQEHALKVQPLAVTCDTFRHDNEAEIQAITWAIDFDKWQHSWHHEVKPENYNHFLEIIQNKVIEKSQDLVRLNAVAMFLQNKIKQLNDDGILTVKSPEKIAQEDKDYEPF